MAGASEERPLGMKLSSGVEIPPESATVGGRTLSVAARLLCGATTFFFLAFLFAYFYLRSINQHGWWKPTAALLKEHEDAIVSLSPNQGLGAVFIACIALSVLLSVVAGRQMKAGSRGWVGIAVGAVLLGLAAVVVQCIAYTSQPFGPTDGAYASVFCAWTGFYLIAVLGSMYWLETQIATELRARRQPAGSEGDIEEPDLLIAPALDAAVFYWAFLGGLGVVMYVTLYLL